MAFSTTLKVFLLLGATAQALILPTSYPSASSSSPTPTTMLPMVTSATAITTATVTPAPYPRSEEQGTDGLFDDIYIDENGELVSGGDAEPSNRIEDRDQIDDVFAKMEKAQEKKKERLRAQYQREKASGRRDWWD